MELENQKEKVVFQHNIITSARYDYSATMLDVLFMVLSILEKDKKTYNLHISDIEAITGRKWNYKQLHEAVKEIGNRSFEIKKEDKKKYTNIWLFERLDYKEGSGYMTITINNSSYPYFFELKNNFTSLQLKSILSCTSKYAKRIYGLACQWRSAGEKKFEIKELKEILGLIDSKGNEQFAEISAFKKRVLEIAQLQINQSTDVIIDIEYKKWGRSLRWVILKIKPNTSISKQIDLNTPIDIQKFKSHILSYGLTEYQANLIATNSKQSEFEKTIKEVSNKLTTGEVKTENAVKYIVGIYKNKGIIPKHTI